MSDKPQSLYDLYVMQLKDLYSVENQQVKALPEMATAAKDGQLRKGFEAHLRETKEQLKRLTQIAQDLGEGIDGDTCQPMRMLVAETQDVLDGHTPPEVQDAALIAAAQRIEHFEIAGYGTAAYYAERLGHSEAADILRQTLGEEQQADTRLNDLAKSYIDQKAVK